LGSIFSYRRPQDNSPAVFSLRLLLLPLLLLLLPRLRRLQQRRCQPADARARASLKPFVIEHVRQARKSVNVASAAATQPGN
jgi:hypothetical protein